MDTKKKNIHMHLKVFRKAKSLVKDAYTDTIYFSFLLACLRFACNIFIREKKLRNFYIKIAQIKNKIIMKCLTKKYGYIFEKYRNESDIVSITENPPIWIFWWQGETAAPYLVKRCIETIHINADNHKVYFISKENYKNYIDIPLYIQEKVKTGKMLIAHFSDIVRVCLLKKYGGLWLDATIFCTKPIPKDVFQYTIYSCKSKCEYSDYVSNYRWVTFLIASLPNTILTNVLKDFYFAYWKMESHAIDYLLLDYAITLAYDNIPAVKYAIDNIPYNTPQRDCLAEAFFTAYSYQKACSIFDSKTWAYKLSWREPFPEYASDGKKTFFYHFIHDPDFPHGDISTGN